jgi:uncharacterized protein (DUF2147 family)
MKTAMKTAMKRRRAVAAHSIFRFSHFVGRIAASAVLFLFLTTSSAVAQVALPQGVWLIDGRAAVKIFDCDGMMCGRIIWLVIPRDEQGQLDRDKNNPDPQLQQRPLCGLTIFWNLQPAGANRWRRGWFYNPRDGVTYRVSAQLTSDDVIRARIYVGIPLLGKDKILARIPEGATDGWC